MHCCSIEHELSVSGSGCGRAPAAPPGWERSQARTSAYRLRTGARRRAPGWTRCDVAQAWVRRCLHSYWCICGSPGTPVVLRGGSFLAGPPDSHLRPAAETELGPVLLTWKSTCGARPSASSGQGWRWWSRLLCAIMSCSEFTTRVALRGRPLPLVESAALWAPTCGYPPWPAGGRRAAVCNCSAAGRGGFGTQTLAPLRQPGSACIAADRLAETVTRSSLGTRMSRSSWFSPADPESSTAPGFSRSETTTPGSPSAAVRSSTPTPRPSPELRQGPSVRRANARAGSLTARSNHGASGGHIRRSCSGAGSVK